jgi:hypothetical protein
MLPYLFDDSRPDFTLASLTKLCRIYIANNHQDEALEVLNKHILSVLEEYESDESNDDVDGDGVAVVPLKWCDLEWAKDRRGLICDAAFDVVYSMKDVEKALALVKVVGSDLRPTTADKLIELCVFYKLKHPDIVLALKTCADAGLYSSHAYSVAIAECYKVKGNTNMKKM